MLAFSFRQLLTRWSNISLPTALADLEDSVRPAGLYFARLQNGGNVINKRLVLIK